MYVPFRPLGGLCVNYHFLQAEASQMRDEMHLSLRNTLYRPHAKFAGCTLYSNVPECGDMGSLPFIGQIHVVEFRQKAVALEVIEYEPTLDT